MPRKLLVIDIDSIAFLSGMSVFKLKSDFGFFLRIKETGIKLINYSQNMDISNVSKDRLGNGKELDNPSYSFYTVAHPCRFGINCRVSDFVTKPNLHPCTIYK